MTDRYGEDWKAKVIGVGTDGASVILGKKSGVVVKIKEHTNSPLYMGFISQLMDNNQNLTCKDYFRQ